MQKYDNFYSYMKKFGNILFFLFAFCTTINADVIVTNDNRKIACKVLEVNIETLQYKRADNAEGPTYTISKDEIKSVTYDNGTTEYFSKKRERIYIAEPVSYNGEEVVFSQKRGFSFANGDSISESQYLYLTQQYCMEANKQYLKGEKLRRAGKWLIAVGLPTTIIGAGLHIAYNDNERNKASKTTGIILWAVGAPTLCAGIPLYVVGIKQKKQSVTTFNRNRPQKSLSLFFAPDNNSIGMAFNF